MKRAVTVEVYKVAAVVAPLLGADPSIAGDLVELKRAVIVKVYKVAAVVVLVLVPVVLLLPGAAPRLLGILMS